MLKRMTLLVCLMASLTFSTVENENSSSSANKNNLNDSVLSVSNTVADSQFQKMEADTISIDSVLVKDTTKEVVDKSKARSTWTGGCTWYGKSHHGNKTASGKRFDMYGLTAASNVYSPSGVKIPFGSKVRVTNLSNGKSVIVTITDRGGFAKTHPRNLDLSLGAFTKIASKGAGRLTKVKFELL